MYVIMMVVYYALNELTLGRFKDDLALAVWNSYLTHPDLTKFMVDNIDWLPGVGGAILFILIVLIIFKPSISWSK